MGWTISYGVAARISTSWNMATIPSFMTGDDLKLSKDEWFSRDKKDKAFIAPQMMKPSSGIFESNRFLIASLRRQFPKESYFAVLDKKTGNLWRTGKHTQPFIGEPAPYRTSEYFIDDMVSVRLALRTYLLQSRRSHWINCC